MLSVGIRRRFSTLAFSDRRLRVVRSPFLRDREALGVDGVGGSGGGDELVFVGRRLDDLGIDRVEPFFSKPLLLPAVVKLAPFGVTTLNLGISFARFDAWVLVMTATARRRFPIPSVLISRSSSRARRHFLVPCFHGCDGNQTSTEEWW